MLPRTGRDGGPPAYAGDITSSMGRGPVYAPHVVNLARKKCSDFCDIFCRPEFSSCK